MTEPLRVAVCVITYQRPAGLRSLLQGLNALTFRGQAPAIRCIVADNDPQGSARAVVEAVRAGFRWGLEFVVEPRRGIPFARNAVMRQALPDAEWIAFIDDDEVPRPDWLDQLLHAAEEYEADVVAGPVEPRFESEAPEWVVKGAFFARTVRPSGRWLDRSATGNVAFRAEILKKLNPWFDEGMALTGGTDILFFRRVHRAGFRIVRAHDAVVTETVPESRMNAGWIWRRAFRYGAATTRIELSLRGILVGVPLVMVLGAYKAAKGAVFVLPSACIRGKVGWVKHIRLLCAGVGMFYGLVGGGYEEYRMVHGR